jgi:CheY-like chemotaxis protein
VKQHDGLIDIDTAPGHGTAVHIYFPSQNAQTQSSSELLGKVAADAASSAGTATASSEKKVIKILVVDDDTSIRTLCQRILKDAYQVGISASAQEALSELKTNNYDILLTDLKMPGMDGLSLMQEAIKTNPALRLVAMTGHMTDEVTQKLKRSGLKHEFVRKPFTPLQLQEAITRIL